MPDVSSQEKDWRSRLLTSEDSKQAIKIGIIFLLSFITFNILFTAATSVEYFKEIIAALIATILTATITTLLLRRQTEGQEKIERSVEVFRRKVDAYDNFLKIAIEHLADWELTLSEARDLHRYVYQLSLISSENTIETVTQFLRSHALGDTDEVPLIDLVSCFRNELMLDQVGDLTGSGLEGLESLFRSGLSDQSVYRKIRDRFDEFANQLQSMLENTALRQTANENVSFEFSGPEGMSGAIAFIIESEKGLVYTVSLVYPENKSFKSVLLRVFLDTDELGREKRENASRTASQNGYQSEPSGDDSEADLLVKEMNVSCTVTETDDVRLSFRGVAKKIVDDIISIEHSL